MLVILFVAALYAVTVGVVYLAMTQSCTVSSGQDVVRIAMFVLMLPLLVKYVFQLSVSPFYSLARRKRRREAGSFIPSVSVLIPAWNEEVGIVRTIDSVVETGYPDLQIIVINDGSTDSTHERVSEYIAKHEAGPNRNIDLTYLQLPNGGKARAMNRGLRKANGEIIVTVDADSLMDRRAIEHLVIHFLDPQVGGVAGNVVVGNRSRPIEWMQQMEYLYGFFFKRADSLFNSVYIIGGAAAAYRRSVIEEVGGFDHSIITEDIELSTRILSRGYKTQYAADAAVYTEGPSDFSGLCNQRLRWKHGRILTFLKHRNLFFSLDRKHSPYLSFMLLPLAVYAECLLLAEALTLSVFMLYTVSAHDYWPLVFVIALLSTVVGVQIMSDSRRRFHSNLFLLAPVAWLIFYVMDMVELQALIRSLKRLIRKEELKWQKWVRVGVMH